MKATRKALCMLLSALLLFASAPFPSQAQDLPASSAPEAQDPLLAGLAARFAAARLETVRLDLPQTGEDSHQGIRVTAGLMRTLGEVLTNGALKRLGTPMRGISGDFPSCMVQLWDGDANVHAELFGPGKRGDYPKDTIVWLQVGEETAHYIAPAALYGAFLAPLDAATYDRKVQITGDTLPLALPEPGSPLSLECALQFDGWLALLRKDHDQSRVDLLSSADGSLLGSIRPGEPIERIEPNLDDPALLRVYTKSGVSDYRSDGSLARAWSLPPEISRHFTAADRYPENRFSERGGRVLFGAKDGIRLWEGKGEPRLVLPNAGLPDALDDRPAGMEPVYTEPRLMNGGRTAVAAIELPGSQSGKTGLVLLDLESGKADYHTDVFAAMTASLSFPDDRTVVAYGGGITRIDLAAKTRQTGIDFGGILSPDGNYSVRDSKSLSPQGTPVHALVLQDRLQEEAILRVDGDRFSLLAVTNDFAICSYEDSERSGFLAVPLAKGENATPGGGTGSAAFSLRPRREVYASWRTRIHFLFQNNSTSPVELSRAVTVEAQTPEGWRALPPAEGEDPRKLDRPDVEEPVQPGEERSIGFYIGWIGEKEGKRPAGRYRVAIPAGGETLFAEYEISAADEPQDAGYSITAALPVITGEEEKLAFQVSNNTPYRLFYGLACWLERHEGGKWITVEPLRRISFPEISVDCPAWGTSTNSFNLKGDYAQPLPPGEYRIVKEIGRYGDRCYAPFRVA